MKIVVLRFSFASPRLRRAYYEATA